MPSGLVSVDALAVYKEMDIGTAKPSRSADPASRHHWHLVDLCEPEEEFSVASFQRAAESAVAEIHSRATPALFVGGTGLYHRAVSDGLTLPGRYPEVATRLWSEIETDGPSALHRRLFLLDPVAAGRMEPGNRRRIVRALEVTEGSGRRFSDYGPGLSSYPPTATLLVGLYLERGALEERLSARLSEQMDEGFLQEVGALVSRHPGLSRTARQAIGYRELISHLAGECDLDEALEAARRRLRSFARRQEAWFRRDPRVQWQRADSPDLRDRVLEIWEST